MIADLTHDWGDTEWMSGRGARQALDAPMSIYELHLGSWGRTLVEGQRFPNYRALAGPLAEHCLAHGFTHVELLPIMEHPFYGSWGYQTTGYFAPTSRYGSPAELMAMIDELHQRGVGVCGVYTYEVAETKVNQTMEFARRHQHPLQCTLEKE